MAHLVLRVQQLDVDRIELDAAGKRLGQRSEGSAGLAGETLQLLSHRLGPGKMDVDTHSDMDEIQRRFLDAVPVHLCMPWTATHTRPSVHVRSRL